MSGNSRDGVWIESLSGGADHGPYEDEVSASMAMDDLNLNDKNHKIVIYS